MGFGFRGLGGLGKPEGVGRPAGNQSPGSSSNKPFPCAHARYPRPARLQLLGNGGPNDWVTALREKNLAAFAYDEPLLRFIDSLQGCDLR